MLVTVLAKGISGLLPCIAILGVTICSLSGFYPNFSFIQKLSRFNLSKYLISLAFFVYLIFKAELEIFWIIMIIVFKGRTSTSSAYFTVVPPRFPKGLNYRIIDTCNKLSLVTRKPVFGVSQTMWAQYNRCGILSYLYK